MKKCKKTDCLIQIGNDAPSYCPDHNNLNMKTNIGSINNRYSEEKAKQRHEDRMNSFWNVVIAVLVAIGVALVISFLTIPR